MLRFTSGSSFYTVGRTPWTGISPTRGHYLHIEQDKQKKRRQTTMPWVGFEPTILEFDLAKTVHPLVRVATVMGCILIRIYLSNHRIETTYWKSKELGSNFERGSGFPGRAFILVYLNSSRKILEEATIPFSQPFIDAVNTSPTKLGMEIESCDFCKHNVLKSRRISRREGNTRDS
jgi:hypothetical protein